MADREPDPDTALLQAIRTTGSRQALEQLLGRHLTRIRRVVRGMVLDETAVDDLTQDTFLSAVRALPAFNEQSSFSTWLTRIALNAALGHLRGKRRPCPVASNDMVDQAAAPASRSPIAAAQQSEFRSDIEAALASLEPPLRAAIVLTVFDDFTPSQAAVLEGCPLGTMYWRIHEARRQLRKKLAEHLA